MPENVVPYGAPPESPIYGQLASTLAGQRGTLRDVMRRRLYGARGRVGGARRQYMASLGQYPGAQGADPNAAAFNLADLERSLAQSGAQDELAAYNDYATGDLGVTSDYVSRYQNQRQFDARLAAEREAEEAARRERRSRERRQSWSDFGGSAAQILTLLALL